MRDKADLEFDENHTLVGGIGVTVDITERRQREEQLRQTQERLELALRGCRWLDRAVLLDPDAARELPPTARRRD